MLPVVGAIVLKRMNANSTDEETIDPADSRKDQIWYDKLR